MNTKTIVWTLAVLLIIVVVFFVILRGSSPQPLPLGEPITASYSCASGKTITANYYVGGNKPQTDTGGGSPTPGGKVTLVLSDGRTLDLPQTISADGSRYANPEESVVFWNKGNGVTFTENGAQTFTGCIEVSADPGGLTQVYENGTQGFSIRYPSGFTVDEKYIYQALGPGKDIGGVKFIIPAATSAGTNLASDSYVSVEEISEAQSCSASLFLDQNTSEQALSDGDMTYSIASSTGAGAGNRYEETVYAIPGTNPCMAVRYFIHSSVIENYPAGTVTEFNKTALLNQFDSIRRTLIIAQTK